MVRFRDVTKDSQDKDFEQEVTEETEKPAARIQNLLCSLCYLLFKKELELLFT
jgi:hypothetical protein